MTINVKEFLLGVVAASSSVTVFWMWHRVTPKIVEGQFQNYTDFLWPVTSLIAAAALFSLSALFIRNGWVLYPAAVVAIGVPYFFLTATTTVAVLLAISLLLAIYAAMRVRVEMEHSLGFSSTKFLKSGLPLYFTVASLVISVFLFSEIGEDENKAIATLLPRSALETAIGPLQSLVGFSNVKSNATIDEALAELIVNQLKSQGIGNVPKAELAKLIASQRVELSKNFGLKLSGKERLSDILYEFVSHRLRELLGPYRAYLPYASALTFFLAFKTLTFPLYYLTLLITFLLIKFMAATRIVRSEMQKVEVERLSL